MGFRARVPSCPDRGLLNSEQVSVEIEKPSKHKY